MAAPGNEARVMRMRLRAAGVRMYETSSEQVREAMAHLFRSLDRDGDGCISLWELRAACESHQADAFISQILRAQLPYLFDLLDANGDNQLDFDECKALYFIVASRVFCFACRRLILLHSHHSCLSCQIHLCSSCDHGHLERFRSCHQAHDFRRIQHVFVEQRYYNDMVQCVVCGDLHQRMVRGFTGHPQHIERAETAHGYMCEWCATWRCGACGSVSSIPDGANTIAYHWFQFLRCQNCLNTNNTNVLGLEAELERFLESPTL